MEIVGVGGEKLSKRGYDKHRREWEEEETNERTGGGVEVTALLFCSGASAESFY